MWDNIFLYFITICVCVCIIYGLHQFRGLDYTLLFFWHEWGTKSNFLYGQFFMGNKKLFAKVNTWDHFLLYYEMWTWTTKVLLVQVQKRIFYGNLIVVTSAFLDKSLFKLKVDTFSFFLCWRHSESKVVNYFCKYRDIIKYSLDAKKAKFGDLHLV